MDRVTVQEAARRLGVTEQAVRKRVKRGTLESEREAGRVYVYLDVGYEPRQDAVTNRDALIEELRDRVESLEEANREHRRIIAGLVQRIPELEAPPATPEEAEPASEPAGGVGDQDAPAWPETETSQGSGGARPWWRRLFGRNAGSR